MHFVFHSQEYLCHKSKQYFSLHWFFVLLFLRDTLAQSGSTLRETPRAHALPFGARGYTIFREWSPNAKGARYCVEEALDSGPYIGVYSRPSHLETENGTRTKRVKRKEDRVANILARTGSRSVTFEASRWRSEHILDAPTRSRNVDTSAAPLSDKTRSSNQFSIHPTDGSLLALGHDNHGTPRPTAK